MNTPDCTSHGGSEGLLRESRASTCTGAASSEGQDGSAPVDGVVVLDLHVPPWSQGLSRGHPLGIDLEAAARHLAFLDAAEPRHTFQVAPDVTGAPRRIYHGPLHAVARQLIRDNEDGAGVYVMVNAGDLLGRKRENVRHVRFVFVDLDGAPVPDDLDAHGLVWSSPGKAHLYWRVDGVSVELFRPIQLGLARTLGGDGSVTDPPRVLRLAGFLHRKREPFRVLAGWLDHDALPLSLGELRERFQLADVQLRAAEEAARRRELARPTPSPAAAETFPEKLLEVVSRKAAGILSTGRHDLVVWTARTCLDNGLTESEASALTLRARDLLPARDSGPVPDAEVLEAVAWAYANLQPGTPWGKPPAPPSSAASTIPPLLAGRPPTRPVK